mmetsp:Transcript_72034/g.204469  ORF Transcript_72034/g.204469 Transcript_72034/m.204469 type:complete len:249 (+) Transcript_72034:1145-1891(+)
MRVVRLGTRGRAVRECQQGGAANRGLHSARRGAASGRRGEELRENPRLLDPKRGEDHDWIATLDDHGRDLPAHCQPPDRYPLPRGRGVSRALRIRCPSFGGLDPGYLCRVPDGLCGKDRHQLRLEAIRHHTDYHHHHIYFDDRAHDEGALRWAVLGGRDDEGSIYDDLLHDSCHEHDDRQGLAVRLIRRGRRGRDEELHAGRPDPELRQRQLPLPHGLRAVADLDLSDRRASGRVPAAVVAPARDREP